MLSVKGHTTDVDLGAERLIEQVKRLDGARIDVGLFEGDVDEEGKSLAVIGAIQEFGSPAANIPKRPWLGRATRENQSKWQQRFQEVAFAIISGRSNALRMMTAFGDKIAKDVRRTINAITTPRNAPSTVARKGFDDPLVETGLMRATVRSRVSVGGVSRETAKGATGRGSL